MTIRLAWLCIAAAAVASGQSQDAVATDARGVELARAGKLREALAQFQSAIDISPAFPAALYHLGLTQEQLGRTDAAIASFEAALRQQPDMTPALHQLAGCCSKRGDFEGELRLLRKVTGQRPDFAEARFNYGVALQKRDDIAAALEQLRAASRLDPRNGRYVLAYGIALANRSSPEAVAVLKHAVELAPANAEAHYNLALAQAAAGDPGAAIGEFQLAIRLDGGHAQAYRGLGVTLMHEDRFEEAAEQLRRALAITPADSEALNNLGLARLRLKDVNGAIESLESAIQSNPSLIKAHFNLAQAYQRAGCTADAKRETERGASLTAEQRSLGRAMLLVQSARQHSGSGNRTASLSELREAVRTAPGYAEAHYQLALAIIESGGDRNEALRELRTVVNLDPERAGAHYQIGLVLLQTGEKVRALDELKAALDMAPCRVEMMRALGRAAFDARQFERAATLFARVVAWDPADKESRSALEQALSVRDPKQ